MHTKSAKNQLHHVNKWMQGTVWHTVQVRRVHLFERSLTCTCILSLCARIAPKTASTPPQRTTLCARTADTHAYAHSHMRSICAIKCLYFDIGFGIFQWSNQGLPHNIARVFIMCRMSWKFVWICALEESFREKSWNAYGKPNEIIWEWAWIRDIFVPKIR